MLLQTFKIRNCAVVGCSSNARVVKSLGTKLRLLWLVSVGWISTAGHNFFAISYRFLEKMAVF